MRAPPIPQIVEEDFAEVEMTVGAIMEDPGAVIENLTAAANLNLIGAAQALLRCGRDC